MINQKVFQEIGSPPWQSTGEHLWEDLREKEMGNQLFDSINKLEDSIDQEFDAWSLIQQNCEQWL